MVDSDSTYTWIRRKRLERLDIKPSLRRGFKVIDNRIVERDVGKATAVLCGGPGGIRTPDHRLPWIYL